METILVGAGIYALTLLAQKLQKKLPKLSLKVLAAILCLIAGAVYYFLQQNQPALLEQTTKFIVGALWTAQWIFVLVDKLLPKEVLPTNPTA